MKDGWYPGKRIIGAAKNKRKSTDTKGGVVEGQRAASDTHLNESTAPETRMVGNPVGLVNLQIFDLKFAKAVKPRIKVELEGQVYIFDNFAVSGFEIASAAIPFSDVSSNIAIYLVEDYAVHSKQANDLIGRIGMAFLSNVFFFLSDDSVVSFAVGRPDWPHKTIGAETALA